MNKFARFCIRVALLLACAATPSLAGWAQPRASERKVEPFPRNDGFVYPGDPGTEMMGDYYRRWAEHVAKLPPAQQGMPPALESLAWMVGRWQAVSRDYERDPAKGHGMFEIGRGPTSIDFTPDQRWLHIQSELRPDRSNARYIGYDRAERQFVFQEIAAPGIVYLTPTRSHGWRRDRMTFGPTSLLYYGLSLTDRITIVRVDNDQFRIVVEGRLPNGTFMAVDDIVYKRVSGRR
jgi:hypothetical protein